MKPYVMLFLVVFTTLFFIWIVAVQENGLLANLQAVQPPPQTTLEAWLESFRFWGVLSVAISGAGALLWFISAQWLLKVDNWRAGQKRSAWVFFGALPLIGSIMAMLFTHQAQHGGWVAYLLYFLNCVLCYYTATALFSPSSFKYTAPGSMQFRRYW